MASIASRRKSSRASGAVKRARSLSQEAVKSAERLTLHVLEGGGSAPAITRAVKAPRATRRRQHDDPIGDNGSGPVRAAAVAPIGMKADVSPQLLKAAPAFGDVLLSFGHSVALVQAALDDTALETLKTLAGQSVDVPVLVEQTLDDYGKPVSVQIKSAKMPLTSIIAPSMLEVRSAGIRMDVSVQSFDATSGIQFNQNIASAGAGFSGHGFGFAVSMDNTNINAQFSNMSDFSSGSLMMSLEIVDRTGLEIPKPIEYGIGANMMIRLTKVTQLVTSAPAATPVTFKRMAELSINKVGVNGGVGTFGQNDLTLTIPAGLQFVLGPGTLTIGSTTQSIAAGTLVISRDPLAASEPYAEHKIQATFGDLTKEFTVHL